MTKTELLKWRKSTGLSQTGAAALIGCSRRSIQQWEAGKNKIPKYISMAIAAASKGIKPYGDQSCR